jgi:hypothetical protein
MSEVNFSSNIINLINIYNGLKILLISRKQVKDENYEQIKNALVVKEVPPMNDNEAIDLIQSYCGREIYKDVQNNRMPMSMSQIPQS